MAAIPGPGLMDEDEDLERGDEPPNAEPLLDPIGETSHD
jgi:hypothetical protein